MPVKTYPNNRTFYTRGIRYKNNEELIDDVYTSKLTWTDSVSSTEMPGWRERIKRHEGATTPRSGLYYKVVGHTRGYAHVDWVDESSSAVRQEYKDIVHGDFADEAQLSPATVYSDPTLRAKVVNQALSRFYNNAWSAINRFDGGVFLGEVRETLSLLKKPAKSLRRLLSAYHGDAVRRTRRFYRTGGRIDPIRVKDANKVVADTWLEYSFGMRPLLNDVKGAAEALAQLALDPNEFEPVRAFVEEFRDVSPSDAASFQKVATFNPYRVIYDFSYKAKRGYQCRYIGQVRVSVDNPLLMKRELFGFSPEQFVPTIWNLIPYSFLVDYFTNLGDVISAWSFPVSRIAWHNRTVRSLKEFETFGSMRVPTNGGLSFVKIKGWSGSPIYVKSFFCSFERSAESLGLPRVVLEIPGSSNKWMNISALAFMRRA